MAKRKLKPALIGRFTGAYAEPVLGRIEIEARWQKDDRRPIKVLIPARDIPALKSAIQLFETGEASAPTKPEPPPTPKSFKTIRDELKGV